MLKTMIVAGRDRERLGEIVQIASRFGLGVILARLGLGRGGAEDGDDTRGLPHRTRQALEEAGPVFIKLGQILATRGDILPPEWTAELEKLHSNAPTLPFDALRPDVESALGQPPETAFAHFSPEPLAAASMAQVHRATLQDGREVVLKIRRPGIRPPMEADLRLIAALAAAAEGASPEIRRFAPHDTVRQLAAAVLEELDFTAEGRNADRLRADFAQKPKVVVPEIVWEWTSETLLVMDYIDGTPPADGATLRGAGIDPAAIAALGADIVLDMILINGRFHADPHPGNLLCLSGDRIALLDLGMIGHVSPRRREEFIGFIQSVTAANPAQLADILGLWSIGHHVPHERLLTAAERLVARHGGGRLMLSALVTDFLALMREERMTMPPDLLLIFKALITLDGVLSGIQPDFDLSDAMKRASFKVMEARLSPEHWGPALQALGWELARIGKDAPHLLRAVTRRLEQEPDPVHIRAAASPDMQLLPAARRIAAAIIIGAAMIAGAMLWQ